MCAVGVEQPQTQERAVSWATRLKTEFRGHRVHLQPPTFCGFPASNLPNETPRPPHQWSLGGAGGQPGPRTVGANGGSTRVPGAEKIIFFPKFLPDHLAMLGRWKIPKCLEYGLFWDKKWVKNGSKTHFAKSDWTTWDAQTSVFSPFRARGDAFWLLENPKMPLKGAALGAKLGEKWVTNRSKATSNKQATLLLSVLAITPFHGFGLYSTLAISYPRWCPCQIQVLSQKFTGGAPGQGRQAGRCPPKLAHFVPQNSLFGPKRPRNPLKTAKRTPTGATLHVRLNWPVTNSPFLSSNSTICPRTGPKMAKNGLECAQLVLSNPKPKNGPYLGLRGSKPNSEGTESTCNPPLFVVSQPQICPTRHLDPRTSGHLVEPEDSPARARWGPMVDPQGSRGGKNHFFPKVFARPLGHAWAMENPKMP